MKFKISVLLSSLVISSSVIAAQFSQGITVDQTSATNSQVVLKCTDHNTIKIIKMLQGGGNEQSGFMASELLPMTQGVCEVGTYYTSPSIQPGSDKFIDNKSNPMTFTFVISDNDFSKLTILPVQTSYKFYNEFLEKTVDVEIKYNESSKTLVYNEK